MTDRAMILPLGALGVALVLACTAVALLLAVQERAEATFPGENGKLAFVSESSIYTVNPDGSNLEQVPIDVPTGVEVSPFRTGGPDWSPDGSGLAFVGHQRTAESCSEQNAIYVVDADGSGLKNITSAHDNLTCTADRFESPAWSPDGSEIVFAHFKIEDFCAVIVKADGSGFRDVPGPSACFAEAETDGISWSPDGSKIAMGVYGIDEDEPDSFLLSDVWVFHTDGSRATMLDAGLASEGQPSFSPDGSKLAFVGCAEWDDLDSTCVSDYDLYTMGADGSSLVQLTDTPGSDEVFPAWSPDGSKTAFVGCPDWDYYRSTCVGDSEIFTIAPDGSGQAEPLPNQPSSSGVQPQHLDWQPIPTENNTDPTISRPRPKPGSTIYDRSPTISAVVRDAESELTEDDIQLWFDGRERGFSYDPDTDQLSRDTRGLSAGRHTVRVVATDKAGNQGTRRWSFEVVRQ